MVAQSSRDEVCILIQRPLIDRDISRHGISALLEAGYRVRVIDLSNIVFPSLNHPRHHYSRYTAFAIQVIETEAVLGGESELLRRAALALVYIGTGSLTHDNLCIFRWLGRAGVPYVISYTNPVPLVSATAGRSVRALSLRFGQRRIVDSVLARCPLTLLGVTPAAVQISGGRASQLQFRLTNKRTRRISAHAWDYELFRSLPETETGTEDIAVYLDTFLGFHDDGVIERSAMPVTPEHFYPRLRALFDRIERERGWRVVIAAHPRADYRDKPGLYGGREIVNGATHHLVQRSRLAIGCHSTSVNFAILARRPVLLLVTEELRNHRRTWAAIQSLAARLRLDPVSIDDPASAPLDAFCVDETAYSAFITEFIKDGSSPDAPFWAIVMDRLSSFGYLDKLKQPPMARAMFGRLDEPENAAAC